MTYACSDWLFLILDVPNQPASGLSASKNLVFSGALLIVSNSKLYHCADQG